MALALVAKFQAVPDFYAGTNHGFNVQVFDLDVDPTGNSPRDITNDIIKWTLARIVGGTYQASYVLQKTTKVNGGIVKTNAGIGWLRIGLMHADTVKLLGFVHQELEIFDAAGESVIAGVGDFEILRNVKNT